MEIKTVVLVSFILGFIVGCSSDHAKKIFYAKLKFIDHIIVLPPTFFVIYAFFQSINFGFMSILQILLGSYIGVNSYRFFKNIFKK